MPLLSRAKEGEDSSKRHNDEIQMIVKVETKETSNSQTFKKKMTDEEKKAVEERAEAVKQRRKRGRSSTPPRVSNL